MYLRRKVSFYSGARSSGSRLDDSQINASMMVNNSVMDLNTSVFDSHNDSGLNKSQILFANIINRKRKRNDSLAAGDGDDNHAEVDDGRSPVRKVRKRLNSFSDSHGSKSTGDGSLMPLESTHLPGHMSQHLDHVKFNVSSIPNIPSHNQQQTTPVKRSSTNQKTEFQSTNQSEASNVTPVKRVNSLEAEEFFSPGKRVNFNLKPQPPTPKSGVKAKSILKTPSKESPDLRNQSPQRSNIFKTPNKTPSKSVSKMLLSPAVQSPLATHCSSRTTPVKITPRRDISTADTRVISISDKSPVLSSKKVRSFYSCYVLHTNKIFLNY